MKKYIPSFVLGLVLLAAFISLFVYFRSYPQKKVGVSDGGEKVLAMELSDDGSSYTVTGIGSYEGTDIIIPAEYKGVPIKEIGERAFRYKSEITSVTIPDTVEVIRESAFVGTSITEIAVPNSVRIIEDYAFYKCEKLERAILPKNIENLGEHLFEECSKLVEVALPENLTVIPAYMFTRCTLLESVVLPAEVESIGEYAFSVCNSLRHIDLPKSVKTVSDSAFNMARLEEIILPSGIKEIGANAFSRNPLTEIELPDSLEKIGSRAFLDTDIGSVYIPYRVTEIGFEAFGGKYGFSDNGGISEITVSEENSVYYSSNNCIIIRETGELVLAPRPDSVPNDGSIKIIGPFAYANADADRVSIPEGVTLLKSYAVSDFERIDEILLPASLEKIETAAISAIASHGESVEKILFKGTHDQWAAIERDEEWLSDTDNVLLIDVID